MKNRVKMQQKEWFLGMLSNVIIISIVSKKAKGVVNLRKCCTWVHLWLNLCTYAVEDDLRAKRRIGIWEERWKRILSTPNILFTFSPAEVPGYEKGGAHSYAIKCRLPCQATDGSPAAYWKDISFGRVPPIQLIHANFPRGCGNLFCLPSFAPPSTGFAVAAPRTSLVLGRKFATSRNSRPRCFSLEWLAENENANGGKPYLRRVLRRRLT